MAKKRKHSELQRKVGKLLVGRMPGTELDDDTRDMLESGIISGVTLFRDNVASAHQLVKLCATIHASYEGTALISVDEEGGAVARCDDVLSPLPSPMSVAATGDLSQARAIFELTCRQLSVAGINCLLAPVLDITSNPRNPIIGTRSFGSDPSLVTSLGLTMATTASRLGVMAVGKHFPGHGATHEDSHTQLAVNRSDAVTLWQRELVPFRGCAVHLPSIMVGHIWMPSIDRLPVPASMSPKVITALLRQYLQYEGLIMTDDMLMKAITDKWGLEEACVLAVAAGAEQVLMLGNARQIRSVHKALVSAVADGRIAEWQIEAAIKSIDESRKELPPRPYSADLKAAELTRLSAELKRMAAEGKETCLKSACLSVSILRGRLPSITEGEWVVLSPEHPRYQMDLAPLLAKSAKAANLTKKVKIISRRYPVNPSSKDCREIVEFCRDRNLVYLTYRTLSNTGQIRLGKALSESKGQKVTVACDVPYDLIGLAAWDNCLATFDPSDLAMEALSRVLTGGTKPAGSCPVSLETEII